MTEPANQDQTPPAAADAHPFGLRAVERAALALDVDAILAEIDGAAYRWDVKFDRLTWSPGALALFGFDVPVRIASGRAYRKLISARSAGTRENILSNAEGDTGAKYSLRYELSLPRGPVVVEDHGRWFPDEAGRPGRFEGIVRVLDRNAVGGRPSSGLNDGRFALLDAVDHLFALVRNAERTFGLVAFSMIGLDAVLDRHGSEIAAEIGDELERRIESVIRRTDKLFRFATNRIAVVLSRCNEDELPVVAERLVAVARQTPIDTGIGQMPIRMICGGIIAPNYARDGRTLLRRAEEALERARRTGLDFVAYQPDRRSEARRRQEQELADDVLAAMRENRITIARQPIVRAGNRTVAFHEALIRLKRDDGSIIGAGAIVPLFEKLGRIEIVDLRVLDLVLAALRAEPDLSLSINVSVATLAEPRWMATLEAALRTEPALAPRLVVEMTEPQAIEDESNVKATFTRVRGLGARTAIDDFGAGHTSFRHLRGLDVDILKIDGAFVQDVIRSPQDGFFVRTLVDLASHLGIETVAEWVRDEESAKLLASWGIDYLQGDCLGPASIPTVPPPLANYASPDLEGFTSRS